MDPRVTKYQKNNITANYKITQRQDFKSDIQAHLVFRACSAAGGEHGDGQKRGRNGVGTLCKWQPIRDPMINHTVSLKMNYCQKKRVLFSGKREMVQGSKVQLPYKVLMHENTPQNSLLWPHISGEGLHGRGLQNVQIENVARNLAPFYR